MSLSNRSKCIARITHVNFVRLFHGHELLQMNVCSSLILCGFKSALLSDSVVYFVFVCIFSTDLFWFVCVFQFFFNILFVVKI